MKKLLSALLLAAVLISAVSCTGGDASDTTAADTKSETTTAATTEAPESSDETQSPGSTDKIESTATGLEVLNAALAKVEGLPAGIVYAMPEESEAKALNEATFSTYFGYKLAFDNGKPAFPAVHAEIESYALRKPSSSMDVIEVDVIKFKPTATDDIIKELCDARVTKIKNDYANNAHYDTEGANKKHVDAVTYKVFGSYAVIICAENNAAAFTAAEDAINAKAVK